VLGLVDGVAPGTHLQEESPTRKGVEGASLAAGERSSHCSGTGGVCFVAAACFSRVKKIGD
jgi:hypothetical protein